MNNLIKVPTKNKRVLLLLICSYSILLNAQTPVKTIIEREDLWLGYFNQTRISKRFGIWTDIHFRTRENFINKLNQAFVRVAPIYYLSDKSRLSIGYAYVNHFPAEGHKNISQPEHRGWQQIWWQQDYNGFRTLQWIRLEQRFRRKIADDNNLAHGYNFNHRIRYNLSLFIPLNKKKIERGALFVAAIDELFINFGKNIVYNYFDQNRAFLGLGYQAGKHLNIQLGYMNLFQQRAIGNKYDMVHTIRLFIFHNLDLRKNDLGH